LDVHVAAHLSSFYGMHLSFKFLRLHFTLLKKATILKSKTPVRERVENIVNRASQDFLISTDSLHTQLILATTFWL